VSSTELGSTRSYPPSPNQMVWNIQWQYQSGNTAYGFSSEVDAVNGDLISTNIHMPWQDDQSFYPPKVTEAQALEKARAFIAKAAASIKSSDLQLQDSPLYNFNSNALFGPIQYSFSFNILRNGLPSSADNLSITIDGNGEVISYNKPSEGFVYPSSVPKVTQAQAEKSIRDSFDVGLYYIPIYKNGTPDSWLLSWAPVEQALYALDAHTGKKLSEEGKEALSASVIYADVPKNKEVFQPRNSSVELTAEQAAKLVEKVGDIPAGRKLNNKILSEDYQTPDRKIWRLSWDAGQLTSGFPTQTSAEVDALSGEILNFQSEQFGLAMNGKGKASEAPAGAKKLTAAEAAQKATALVNTLYPEASSTLKQIQYGGDWSLLPDGAGYRYQFIRVHKGIPINSSTISLNLDLYGRLQFYYGNRLNTDNLTLEPVSKITKQEALAQYDKQYKVKLQYKRSGGYSMGNIIAEPKVNLVYELVPTEVKNSFETLDALTGQWVPIFNTPDGKGQGAEATDIKGHSAEQQLAELVKYGILEPDVNGKINPDQEITVGDWITYLAKATQPYYANYNNGNERKAIAGTSVDSPYYDAVRFAVDSGWIGKDAVLQAENKLNREQLAILLTSFVKYSKISAFLDKDAAVGQFSDASSITNKGAVAVTVKLGLLKDEGGKFNPAQNVTKAQAAVIIMKLVELQGKTDQSIGGNGRY
jgi:hypothetical protein